MVVGEWVLRGIFKSVFHLKSFQLFGISGKRVWGRAFKNLIKRRVLRDGLDGYKEPQPFTFTIFYPIIFPTSIKREEKGTYINFSKVA